MMAIGIKKISEKATKRRMFDVCNSTMEMSKRAPHHEFWPNVWKNNGKKSYQNPIKFAFDIN